jgi:hypothetical protein
MGISNNTELLAIFQGLQIARSWNFNSIYFYTDSLTALDSILSHNHHTHWFATIILLKTCCNLIELSLSSIFLNGPKSTFHLEGCISQSWEGFILLSTIEAWWLSDNAFKLKDIRQLSTTIYCNLLLTLRRITQLRCVESLLLILGRKSSIVLKGFIFT